MVFFGPAVFNKYAYTLEGNPLIPIIEIGLLLIFLFHVYKTVRMFLGNQATRPVGYARKKTAGPPSRKTFASSTMIVSGLWLLAFIIIHVRAFRYGTEYDWPDGGRDLYRLEIENFSNPLMVGFYVLSMLVVGSHLWHGISSGFQSLGLDKPAWTRFILPAGKVIAVLIAAGFIVIAVWAYFQQETGRVRV
jgi:succinate dehydrogenase / fumarate reductase cytochrome b subunit